MSTKPRPPQILGAGRTDGYDDTYGNVFQGVRAYDPNASQWTAPDAYAGDVHDPMSQKPFMWNGNNPVSYEDPSGYDWGAIDPSLRKSFDLWRTTPDGKKVYDRIKNDHSIKVDVLVVAQKLLGRGNLGQADQGKTDCVPARGV